MANIDKNPRQITRLRVEDQKKLEQLASVTGFDKGDNTPQFDALYVDGSLMANNLYLYETIDFTDSGAIKYNSNDAEFEFSNTKSEFTVHLHPSATEEEILTDKNVKTLFGNQSIYGTGNIDLYVYTLKLSASFGGGMGYIYIDYQTSDNNNNVEVNSVTKFTTLTKATEGSIISCICSKASGDGVTVIGNNIRYENGVWYVYNNDTKYSYSYQGQVSNATITNCSQLKKRTI